MNADNKPQTRKLWKLFLITLILCSLFYLVLLGRDFESTGLSDSSENMDLATSWNTFLDPTRLVWYIMMTTVLYPIAWKTYRSAKSENEVRIARITGLLLIPLSMGVVFSTIGIFLALFL